jgi:hypothetical protein
MHPALLCSSRHTPPEAKQPKAVRPLQLLLVFLLSQQKNLSPDAHRDAIDPVAGRPELW